MKYWNERQGKSIGGGQEIVFLPKKMNVNRKAASIAPEEMKPSAG